MGAFNETFVCDVMMRQSSQPKPERMCTLVFVDNNLSLTALAVFGSRIVDLDGCRLGGDLFDMCRKAARKWERRGKDPEGVPALEAHRFAQTLLTSMRHALGLTTLNEGDVARCALLPRELEQPSVPDGID